MSQIDKMNDILQITEWSGIGAKFTKQGNNLLIQSQGNTMVVSDFFSRANLQYATGVSASAPENFFNRIVFADYSYRIDEVFKAVYQGFKESLPGGVLNGAHQYYFNETDLGADAPTVYFSQQYRDIMGSKYGIVVPETGIKIEKASNVRDSLVDWIPNLLKDSEHYGIKFYERENLVGFYEKMLDGTQKILGIGHGIPGGSLTTDFSALESYLQEERWESGLISPLLEKLAGSEGLNYAKVEIEKLTRHLIGWGIDTTVVSDTAMKASMGIVYEFSKFLYNNSQVTDVKKAFRQAYGLSDSYDVTDGEYANKINTLLDGITETLLPFGVLGGVPGVFAALGVSAFLAYRQDALLKRASDDDLAALVIGNYWANNNMAVYKEDYLNGGFAYEFVHDIPKTFWKVEPDGELIKFSGTIAGDAYSVVKDQNITVNSFDYISRYQGKVAYKDMDFTIHGYATPTYVTGMNGNDIICGQGGTDVISGGAGNDYLVGGADIDTLDGGIDNDVLVGGTENDTLKGGSGSDRYIFHNGDGEDTIVDTSGTDTIQLEPSQASDLILARTGYDLNITNFHTGDATSQNRIHIKDFFLYQNPQLQYGNRVEYIAINGITYDLLKVFNSALGSNAHIDPSKLGKCAVVEKTSAYAHTDGNDFYEMNNNNVYIGGLGNDTYKIVKPADTDEISDNFVYDGNRAEGIDTIDMGLETAGIRKGNVSFEASPNGDPHAMRLHTGVGGYLTISDFDLDTGRIEQIRFDNTTYNLKFSDRGDIMYDRGYSNANSVVVGFGGDDVVQGGTGNDLLYGQGGVDTLYGGQGSDTYVFNGNFGYDTLNDSTVGYNYQNDTNKLLFGDLKFSQMKVYQSDNDLVLESILNTSNKVKVKNFYTNGSAPIQSFEFLDGTKDIAAIKAAATEKLIADPISTPPPLTQPPTQGNNPPGSGPQTFITIYLNGELLSFGSGVQGYIKDGRSMIPLRALCQKFGASIVWDEVTQEARIVESNSEVDSVRKDSVNAINNGIAVSLQAEPEFCKDSNGNTVVDSYGNGTLMVPANFVADIFKLQPPVWDGTNNTLNLYTTTGSSVPLPPGSSTTPAVEGSNENLLIYVNGVKRSLPHRAYETVNGGKQVPMVPVEELALLMGAEYVHTGATGAGDCTLIKETTGEVNVLTWGLMTGTDGKYNNGLNPVYLGAKTVRDTASNITYADAKFLSETLGYTMTWDANTNVLSFDKGSNSYVPEPLADPSTEFWRNRQQDFFGNDSNNRINGTTNADYIIGNGGADNLYGFQGDDVLYGDYEGSPGGTDDYLEGGDGRDVLVGGGGNDTLVDLSDAGPVYSQWGSENYIDIMDGGTGNDVLVGDAGDSGNSCRNMYLFRAGDGSDTIKWARGNDILVLENIDLSTVDFEKREDALVIHYTKHDSITVDNWTDYHNLTIYSHTGTLSALGYTSLFDGNAWTSWPSITSGGINAILAQTQGTEGNDVMTIPSVPYAGNYSANGGGGNDAITGNAGANEIDGGKGIDTIRAGAGTDKIFGGSDGDFLYGDAGDDNIYGQSGNDFLSGGLDKDTLSGGSGADALYGDAGIDTLYGDEDADKLYGGTEGDTLQGGSGNDELYGEGGNDILYGGSGDDAIYGGADTNTIHFNIGSGVDNVYVQGGTDTVVFGQDVLKSSFKTTFVDKDLVLMVGTQTDAIYVKGWTDGAKLAGVRFADGTVLTASQLEAMAVPLAGPNTVSGTASAESLTVPGAGNFTLYGMAGNDTLNGGAGNDQLVGGKDSDTINAGGGINTIHFELGDGADNLNLTAGSESILQFGTGVTLENLTCARAGNDLVFKTVQAGDSITVKDWYLGSKLNRVRFSNGTAVEADYFHRLGLRVEGTASGDTLTGISNEENRLYGLGGGDTLTGKELYDTLVGGAGNDTLTGDSGNDTLDGGDDTDMLLGGIGNDSLTGGKGSDTLEGGEGSDAYFFNAGDGADTLKTMGSADAIVFGEGIVKESITARLNGNSMVITTGAAGDTLTIENWELGNQLGYLQFADGSILDASALETMAVTYNGTTGSDTLTANASKDSKLFGYGGNDTLNGLAGNDTLSGGIGNDILAGGAGSDTIEGGAGTDVIEFNLGDGRDTVILTGMEDILHLGNGITLSKLEAELDDAGNLILSFGNSDDKLTFVDWNSGSKLASLKLADGTALNAIQIEELAKAMRGTDGDDTLTVPLGENGIVMGFAGNDTITGADGVDVVIGGLGSDTITGGAGVDTYRFNLGDGKDTYTLTGMEDVLELGAGITLANVKGMMDADGNYILTIGEGSDTLTFNAWNAGNKLASIKLADGTVLTTAKIDELTGIMNGTTGDDMITATLGIDHSMDGGAGNDMLSGNTGIDIIAGGTGDDAISGGGGADVYRFNLGDGKDTYTLAGIEDVLELGEGINIGNMKGAFNADGNYILTIGDSTDTLTFNAWNTGNKLASIKLADGTVLNTAQIEELTGVMTGSAGDDTLTATLAIDHVMSGGAGNDTISGNAGKDTYRFNSGDGNDTYALIGIEDVLELGAGITIGNLKGAFDAAGNYILTIGSGTDALTFNAWNTGKKLASIKLADGTVLNTAQIEELTGVMNGTAGDDTLTATLGIEHIMDGGTGNDTLVGNAGSDTIRGGTGNDTLTGGKGNDTLVGGFGSNVYIYNAGDGQDTIVTEGGFKPIPYNWSWKATKDWNGTSWSDGGSDAFDNFGQTSITINGVKYSNIDFTKGGIYDVGGVKFSAKSAFTSDNILELVIQAEPGYENASIKVECGGNLGSDGKENYKTAELVIGGKAYTYAYSTDTSNSDPNIFMMMLSNSGTVTYTRNADNILGTVNSGSFPVRILVIPHRETEAAIRTLIESSYSVETATDTIRFGAGITKEMLTYSRDGMDMIIGTGVAGDTLRVKDWCTGRRISGIEFADGAFLKGSDIPALDYAILGTATGETLRGLDDLKNTVHGLGGADKLYGANLADTLYGDEGNDTLYGQNGNDILIGGTGNDRLEGGAGNDTYNFNVGDGQDTVYDADGTAGLDTIQFGAGFLAGNAEVRLNGSDLTIGFTGLTDQLTISNYLSGSNYRVEKLQFADGTVWDVNTINAMTLNLTGTANTDYLYGTDGNNTLTGLAGNDSLYGNGGNDTLIGGTGNDRLEGGSGNDTYIFNVGDGQDTVYDADGTAGLDTIQFGAGLLAGNAVVRLNGSDLTIGFTGLTDQLTISNYLSGSNYRVEKLQFADGTVWDVNTINAMTLNLTGTANTDYLYGTDGNNTLTGLAGNDSLYGNGGNDTLIGGTGNDRLEGGSGNDTYIFNVGDGQDTVYDADGTAGLDTIQFGAGLLAGNAEVRLNGSDLTIGFTGSTDQLTISNYLSGSNCRVEKLQFADGTVWDVNTINAMTLNLTGTANTDYLYGTDGNNTLTGLAGDDYLYGNGGNDTLIGGTGNDRLEGGAGNDTYVFNIGDGQDTVYDADGTAGLDTVQFGAGLLASNAIVSLNGSDLVIGFMGSTDQITIVNCLYDSTYRVETFRFYDGTVWDWRTISSMSLSQTGSDEEEWLYGTDGINTLIGLGGNDRLRGNGGNDILDGGTGNDVMNGGVGNDTYIFNAGYGQDNIFDEDSTSGNVDRVVFGAGLLASEAVVTIDRWNLVIRFPGSDQLTVSNYLVDPKHRVERFEFADGTVWDWNTISNMSLSQTGTAEWEWLYGTDGSNTLVGFGGNDYLRGNGGNDTLDGGTGDDEIAGGAGNDTYIFNAGYGQDSIFDEDSTSGNVDRVVFGAGLLASEAIVTIDRWNLVIRFPGGDQLTVNNYLIEPKHRVEQFEFADGMVWDWSTISNMSLSQTGTDAGEWLYGTDGNNTLIGLGGNDNLRGNGGNDTLDGGTGNDDMRGGAGNDTYIFNLGYGQDHIFDEDSTSGNIDRVIFGEGLSASNAVVTMDRWNLIISFAGSSDKLTLWNYMVESKHRVERFEFADGTVWDWNTISSMSLSQTGTDTGEWLYGTDGNNTLIGLGGNDNLRGNGGNDTLDGGTGNDDMRGGMGNDTYFFNAGYGQDKIYDEDSTSGTVDRVVFGAGLLASEAIVTIDRWNLVIRFPGSDQLTVSNYLIEPKHRVERFEFADGTVWDWNTISNMPLSQTGTDTGESLYGTDGNNTLIGLGGNDNLRGHGGNDILDGGTGNDEMVGGTGNDTYIFNLGYGQDSIFDEDVTSGNVDRVVFGAGLLASEAIVTIDRWNLVIRFPGSDQLTVMNCLIESKHRVERFEFADGTVWNWDTISSMSLSQTGTSVGESLYGTDGDNTLIGLGGNDSLRGQGGNDILDGGTGNDNLVGGAGNDIYQFNGTFGQDIINNVSSLTTDYDKAAFSYDRTKLVLSRSVNDLKIAVAGQTDSVLVQSWYTDPNGQLEEINTNSGNRLLTSQVDQLIQAMATFTTQTGLTWEQAAQQNNQQYATLLATYYQQ